MNTLRVQPAYGRHYETADAARVDWDAGKDFVVDDLNQIHGFGRYCSKRDFEGPIEVTVMSPAVKWPFVKRLVFGACNQETA